MMLLGCMHGGELLFPKELGVAVESAYFVVSFLQFCQKGGLRACKDGLTIPTFTFFY